MRNWKVGLVTLGLWVFGTMTGTMAAVEIKNLPAGGAAPVACLPYGIEMRDAVKVKSCLLATAGEFTAVGGEKIVCRNKYAIAFTQTGQVEYCTLDRDTELRRTATDKMRVMAGGRTVFYPDGTLEIARLKETMKLPFARNSQVACRGESPVSFRRDGNVATCILDEQSLFVGEGKKKTSQTCQAGGLIAFDEDGKFNGCYPPPPPKPAGTVKTDSGEGTDAGSTKK